MAVLRNSAACCRHVTTGIDITLRLDTGTVCDHFAGAIALGVVEACDVVGRDEADIDENLATFEWLGTP